jgi:hypothetical protein
MLMKQRFLVGVLISSLYAPALGAQALPPEYSAKCPFGTQQERVTQDACVKAIDLFKYLAPQLAATIAGGNAILGSGGALGGIGHISFGLRVNALAGSLPRVDAVTLSTGGAQPSSFETKDQLVALPAADLALGLFAGIPLGLTNVGGVDLLVSASYLPEFDANNVSVKVPGGSIQLGFGARLGLIQESLLLPGVSISVLRRGLPTVDVSAQIDDDSVAVTDFDVETTSWRLVASKSFLMFGLAVGGGQDRYEFTADATAYVNDLLAGQFTRSVTGIETNLSKLTRTTYFADLSWNLPFFRLVGEIGQVSGGEIDTFNQFPDDEADKSRIYGSIGARIGW